MRLLQAVAGVAMAASCAVSSAALASVPMPAWGHALVSAAVCLASAFALLDPVPSPASAAAIIVDRRTRSRSMASGQPGGHHLPRKSSAAIPPLATLAWAAVTNLMPSSCGKPARAAAMTLSGQWTSVRTRIGSRLHRVPGRGAQASHPASDRMTARVPNRSPWVHAAPSGRRSAAGTAQSGQTPRALRWLTAQWMRPGSIPPSLARYVRWSG